MATAVFSATHRARHLERAIYLVSRRRYVMVTRPVTAASALLLVVTVAIPGKVPGQSLVHPAEEGNAGSLIAEVAGGSKTITHALGNW